MGSIESVEIHQGNRQRFNPFSVRDFVSPQDDSWDR